MSDQTVSEDVPPLRNARVVFENWRKRAIVLVFAVAASIASVVPILEGHSLHMYAERYGKYLVYTACTLFTLFVGAAALAYNFWVYWRNLDREYERPPESTS
jgi:hypothetical protein